MALERKESAKFSKSKLLQDFNEIDIYIEDTAKNYDKIYINIFKRVFSGKYRIDNVFPIGSRGSVIKKCLEKSGKIYRPMLFIVDGDLYLLKGEAAPLPKGVFRLPFYCVENLILDVNAIIDYIDEEHIGLREEQVISEFSYDKWRAACEIPLINLFIVYAVVQKLNLEGVKNVSIPLSEFLDPNDSSIIKETSVYKKIKEIESLAISKVGEDYYLKVRAEVCGNIDENICKVSTYVSGKDYLYPLLYSKACGVLNRNISHVNFKQRLAMKCDISKIMSSHDSVLVNNKV